MAAIFNTLGGIMRGLSMQNVVAIIIFVVYFLITVPLCVVLALFWHMGLPGIYLGATCGTIINSILFIIIIFKADWNEISEKSIEMIEFDYR